MTAAHPFTDPVDGTPCVVHFGSAPGVEHTGCIYSAAVFPDLDAFYCTECGRNGRISGAWFLDLLAIHRASAVATEPAGPFTCPRCGRSSYHPDDKREGYCGRCHDWTGD